MCIRLHLCENGVYESSMLLIVAARSEQLSSSGRETRNPDTRDTGIEHQGSGSFSGADMSTRSCMPSPALLSRFYHLACKHTLSRSPSPSRPPSLLPIPPSDSLPTSPSFTFTGASAALGSSAAGAPGNGTAAASFRGFSFGGASTPAASSGTPNPFSFGFASASNTAPSAFGAPTGASSSSR